jgi:hypothetical protein
MSTTDSSPIVQASAISQAATCKLCGATIGHFALRWPDPGGPGGSFNQREFGRLSEAVAQHMQKRAQQLPDHRHAQALAHAAALGGSLTQAFLWRHFDLPEAARGFQEHTRASVHHMTSKFKLTVEMAERLANAMLSNLDRKFSSPDDSGLASANEAVEDVKAAFLALAARYEEGHPAEPISRPENQPTSDSPSNRPS